MEARSFCAYRVGAETLSFTAAVLRLVAVEAGSYQHTSLIYPPRLSTSFAAYLINAESRDEARKWLAGIEILQHTFNMEPPPDVIDILPG